MITSTQALVPSEVFLPAPKFSFFWCSRVLMCQLPACLQVQSQGLILHGGWNRFGLCQHGIYGISEHSLFASVSKLRFIPKAQHTATSLMRASCLLNDQFPLCCHRLGAGRGHAVPPWLSHRCTVLAEFPRTSFLASSVNDNLAIFHLLLSSAVS